MPSHMMYLCICGLYFLTFLALLGILEVLQMKEYTFLGAPPELIQDLALPLLTPLQVIKLSYLFSQYN